MYIILLVRFREKRLYTIRNLQAINSRNWQRYAAASGKRQNAAQMYIAFSGK